MDDAFKRSHPAVNFIYFVVVMGITMFVQHPILLAISFSGALSYSIRLNGPKKVLKQTFLLTLPALIIVALLNPLFNHYGVTMLYYIESSGNWVTLEAMVYGVVLGSTLFIMIEWFSCFNKVMTTDKFVWLFGRITPALSLILSMIFRLVPRFTKQTGVIRNSQKCMDMDISGDGKWPSKVRYGLTTVSILITWALENAIQTADSMKSRGYGLKGRTSYTIYRLTGRDRILMLVVLLLTALFGYGAGQGACFAQYDPRILLAGFTVMGYDAPVACSAWLAVCTFIAYGILCFIPLGLTIYDDRMMAMSRQNSGKSADMTYRMIYETIEREGGTSDGSYAD